MYKTGNFRCSDILTETGLFGAVAMVGSGWFLWLLVVSYKARLLLCPHTCLSGSTVALLSWELMCRFGPGNTKEAGGCSY